MPGDYCNTGIYTENQNHTRQTDTRTSIKWLTQRRRRRPDATFRRLSPIRKPIPSRQIWRGHSAC